MSNIFLFSGSNHFALRQEKTRWIKEFTQKHGDENLLKLDAKNVSVRDLLDEISVAPFISENRLVVVEGTWKCKKDEAKSIADQIHPQVILLFVVPIDPSKRGKLPASMKELEKIAECKLFSLPTKVKLTTWIDSTCKSLGASITTEARELLLEISGDDQDMLLQELKKLSLFAGGEPISNKHVLDLAVTAGEREVWHLMDLLGEGRVEEGILYAESLIKRGDDPYGLWSRLLWSLSQLTLIWTAVQEGITHPAAISKEAGVPFPTIRALLPSARKMDQESLTRIVDLITKMDIDVKTGALRATADDSEELKAVIDRCLMEFSNS